MLYQSALSEEFQFEKINITDNRKFLGNLGLIIKSKADLFYFTISQTKAGNLRDLIILKVLGLQKKKCLVHLHGGYYRSLVDNELPCWQKKANYKAINQLTGVIVLGNSMKKIFQGMISDDKIYVVPNCVDDDYVMNDIDFDKKMELFQSANINHVLYLSNFIKSKGYEKVFEMAKMEKERCYLGVERKFHFHFAGKFFESAEEKNFIQSIQEHQLQDYVTYHGIATGKDKEDLLEKCTVFMLLTRYPKEGQPISILEAMGNGMMIVTTDHAGIPDIVQNDVNGIICTQDMEVKEIYEKVIQMDMNRIHNQCVLNREYVKKYFSEAFHIANMRKVFEELS